MRRIVNRLLGVVLALALVAGAAVVIVEVVGVLVGARPVLVDWPAALDWARRTRWDAGVVRTAGAAILLVGLALTVFELWPSRAGRLPVDSDEPGLEAAVTRRGVQQEVRAAVAEVDGASPRHVSVRPGRIRVRIASRIAGQEPQGLRDAVLASVGSHLDRLHLRRRPSLAVSVERRS
ncbi:DUF6286 domain-containing protein [Hamadaea tsunoensis]|uniref:DUF6286 domain-containing protein n=1 Tax=Hamadaea tsunoensis TaxID=53368 RepID=UPI0003F94995|nr:DUF6286 domain-containing protein [Hamadaea tsunoensis]